MQIRVWARPRGERADELARHHEPLTFGVPVPRGAVTEHAAWALVDESGHRMAVQVRPLDRWVDGSIRWALIDAQSDLSGSGADALVLEINESIAPPAIDPGTAIVIQESGGAVTIDTHAAKFTLRPGRAFPFDTIAIGDTPALATDGSTLSVTDAQGVAHTATVDAVQVEESGPLRVVVKLTGAALVAGRALSVTARLHFYAGLATVRVLTTLLNPDRARHVGGFWDLGDAGSLLIKDASLALGLRVSDAAPEVYGSTELNAPWVKFEAPFELYQDSSGGEQWQSHNHLNREHRVTTTFRGYRQRSGPRAQSGLRATPIVALARGTAGAAAAIPDFWQNFPQAIEAAEGTLTLRFLPGQYSDLHELQGGEQKTYEVYLAFGPDGVTSVPLAWCRGRTVASAVPEWCIASGAVPFLEPLSPDHARLVNSAIDGPDRFEVKREAIDEYGWRHFGEIYGDHEGVRVKGSTSLVSHYNNQYDPIAGFAYQVLRTGDVRWWTAMTELASHVIDIDLYHTTRDKSAYNRGMFWHTYHYGEADTATHRTFPVAGKGKIHGGGPSAGHNFTTGLMLHYFLTGDAASRDAVVQLARYVIDLDDGRQTILKWLDSGDTGHAALSAGGYYGPGRGPANSLNALVDGLRLSGDKMFADKADQLLRRVIHPNEDIALRTLDVPEQRWFYTMFMQSLGKWLHSKVERDELDATYAYGRASLLHYARWMADNEYPYLDKPERLEFPTETWPAQDIRKSDAFAFAALHATGQERARFVERARFFHDSSVQTLKRLATRTLARPVVVLLTSGFMQSWIAAHPDASEPPPPGTATDFGTPATFVPQRARAERRLMWLGGLGAAAAVVLIWLIFVR